MSFRGDSDGITEVGWNESKVLCIQGIAVLQPNMWFIVESFGSGKAVNKKINL